VLGLVHPLRAIVGLYLSRSIPQFEELTREAEIRGPEQLEFKSTKKNLPEIYKHILWTSYEPMQLPLKVYAVGSLVCMVIDILAALVFLIFCGKMEWQRVSVFFFQLLIVTVYFYLDIYLFLTVAKWMLRLPNELKRCVPKAIFGFGLELKASFGIQ